MSYNDEENVILEVTRTRLAELVEDLTEDEFFISQVLDHAGVRESDDNTRVVTKELNRIAVQIYEAAGWD